MISTSRWTASPWHFVTWPLVRLRSWGTQPSSPGCCTSCTRGTCAPARGTARSRSRCSRCTGSTPALTPQRSFAVQLQQSAPRTGSELVKQRAMAVERCNGTTNERSASYHVLLVDVRHRRGRDLLVELPPCGRHVAGGPRAHWA